ncbi:hypothetical protein CASFOL_008671 [Castilleja foliolosa]|uniref:Uncharacterized protein n=1 Tax=Castilleja foliolosa TaxID=1961234 RepID=A0ABD3DZX4_9LAMI
MGWSYPELSLQDLMKLIKNFIDMLILASGYQSTGRPAHWDSSNIKKCFQWALFIENVLKDLLGSIYYQDSVKELDAALYDLTSSPCFPQGLAPLSCTTLSSAKDLLLKHLIHTLPLRESHLKAVVTASVEMDFSKLKKIDNDCLDVYLEKLMRKNRSVGKNLSETRDFMEVSNISSPDVDFSVSAVEQLERRQLAVSRLSAVETGLECILKTIGQSMHDELANTSNSEPTKHSANIIAEEMLVEPTIWNRWRSRSLSYMLDKRTIRLLSGANMIFSAPENQWTQMFERLNISNEADTLCETIELLLLGCIGDKWNDVIGHVMSVSYESTTISKLFHQMFNLPLGKSVHLSLKESLINPKEKSVVDYLEVLLSNQLKQLWKLSPVLAAVAIPSWSRLFKSYLFELESQFRGNSLETRRCNCIADAVEHRESVMWLRECGAFTFFTSVDPMPHDYKESWLRTNAECCCVSFADDCRWNIKLFYWNMARNTSFLLSLLTSLLIGVGSADWNILNQRKKIVSGSSLKNYCESWRINVELNNIRDFEVVPQECISYIGKYMTSSQYKADCQRAIEECQLFLSGCCCTSKGDDKDAWIFDIDDTLLSTVPYFKKHSFGGHKLNLTALEEWMQTSKAPALEHTLSLFNDIKEKGFRIFLISTRRESLRDATVDNLIKEGYHGWSGLVLRGLEDENKLVQNYKAKARKKLVKEGYRIWGIIGDQWSSFDGTPSAERTFKLPNSLYYIS